RPQCNDHDPISPEFPSRGLPAADAAGDAAAAALERARFEAALVAARGYADDRSLIFYCLRGSTETVPFLYVGLQVDLEQAVQKMKSAAASGRHGAGEGQR